MTRFELIFPTLLKIGRVIALCRIRAVFQVAFLRSLGGVRLTFFHKLFGLIQTEFARQPDYGAVAYAKHQRADLRCHVWEMASHPNLLFSGEAYLVGLVLSKFEFVRLLVDCAFCGAETNCESLGGHRPVKLSQFIFFCLSPNFHATNLPIAYPKRQVLFSEPPRPLHWHLPVFSEVIQSITFWNS